MSYIRVYIYQNKSAEVLFFNIILIYTFYNLKKSTYFDKPINDKQGLIEV